MQNQKFATFYQFSFSLYAKRLHLKSSAGSPLQNIKINKDDGQHGDSKGRQRERWISVGVGEPRLGVPEGVCYRATLTGVCYMAPLTSAQEDEGLIELILKAINEVSK